MKEMTIEESKKVEQAILDEIISFCDANNLRYFLTYGTLIGAIRHKGFIPWDDDVDIQMPKVDYDKFIDTFKSKYLQVIVPGTPMAKHTFVKVIDTRTVKIEPNFCYYEGYLGVDVDVFPIEGTPDDDDEFKHWYEELMWYYEKYIFVMRVPDNLIKKLLKPIVLKIMYKKPQFYLERIEELHNKYPYETSKYVGSIASLYNSPKNRVPKHCFDSTVLVTFEGKEYKAPAGYDYILRNIYGDYTQLPPEEKRITHHTHKIYWKD